ncbi:MAG: serpin family protein [Patescibacteria group bacterium]|nr:serpin family protein [Patescibacteria group bacterium]
MNKKGLTQILSLGLILALIIIGFSSAYVYLKPKKETNSNTTSSKINLNSSQANINTNSSSMIPVDSLSQAHTIFGLNILDKLYQSAKKDNIFISPTSIALALSMVYQGSDSQTKAEIAETLAISDISMEDLNKQTKNLITQYKDIDPDVEVAIANSIWTRSGFKPKQDFINTLQTWYEATAKALDFNQKESVDEINNWVKENTKDKIESIVNDPISSDVIMYLINATYFKGIWTKEFKPENTQERPFYNGDNTEEQHDFMYQREDYAYLENNDFQAVKLPYGENERLSMYVFLPKDDLESFMAELNSENWHDWLKDFSTKEGYLYLPKIKLEYEKSLNSYLKDLGMKQAFTASADFNKIAADVYISDVLHKTFVEVNEEGTEAAAVTSVKIITTAEEPQESFNMLVNKPYFFAIRDNEIGENLFMGIINNPEY